MSEGSLRLFAALELDPATRAALHAWGQAAAPEGVRIVREENLHVTLAFLGMRPAADVGPAAAALRSAARDPGPLRTTGALWLPPRRPGVLTVALQGGPGLAALQEAVAAGLQDAVGWERDRRPFRPHVTVGRVRRGARVSPGPLTPPAPELSFAAPAVTLFASSSGPGGSHYEPLERVTLSP